VLVGAICHVRILPARPRTSSCSTQSELACDAWLSRVQFLSLERCGLHLNGVSPESRGEYKEVRQTRRSAGRNTHGDH
jgi:hypothetical protein